jgi:restriction system protein
VRAGVGLSLLIHLRCEDRDTCVGVLLGEVFLFVQLAVDAPCNSRGHRSTHGKRVPAHQDNEHHLQVHLLHVGGKPSDTRLYQQWKESQPETIAEIVDDDPETVGTLEKDADAASTVEEAEENAWTQIEQYIQAMNPYDLQKLVAALLRAMSYHVSWISPPGPDKGIDVVAHNDPLGTSAPRIKVQVKRRVDRVNVGDLRSFIAVLGEQDVGIFVSLGGFSRDAEDEARTKETRKLTLVDLEKLVDLWVEHYEKIAEADKRLLPLKPVYYLAPSE